MITFSSEPKPGATSRTSSPALWELHETRERRRRIFPLKWFFQTLPQTFRRHIRAFWMSLAITARRLRVGGFALALDTAAKPALMPFSHLLQDPPNVSQKKKGDPESAGGQKTSFSAF